MKKPTDDAEQASADSKCLQLLRDKSEDEQIATLVKLHQLPPISDTATGIWITGISRTDWFGLQNPNDQIFDKDFPPPIGGRRSDRAPRKYWTVDLLRWRIRLAASGHR